MNNNPSISKRQKKWIWNFNAHQTPINLPPSQFHAPTSPVTITASPTLRLNTNAWQTLSLIRVGTHHLPRPTRAVVPCLSTTKPCAHQLANTHNTHKFLERESVRREKVADPPWPPPRNAITSSTLPSSPNKPNAMKVLCSNPFS